jgi:protein-S-isoprenylcysteine O-methyltransferase Ste14
MNLIKFLPLICEAAVYGCRLAEINTKRNTIAGKVKENLTLRLFVLIGTFTLLASVVEYFLRGMMFSWLWLVTGLVCSAFSFWLRKQAINALGKFWSLHVEIRENHEFVQSGPFRYVRHPAYFSMILELVGFALILNAFFTLLIVPFVFIPALLLRLRIEEPALIEKFGDAYREYQRRTPMLIPYKLPRKS